MGIYAITFAPKGLRLKAQGYRFGYPGRESNPRPSNRNAVATALKR